MGDKEEQGDVSDDAYLSLTKLSREQVGAVCWLIRQRERGTRKRNEGTYASMLQQ